MVLIDADFGYQTIPNHVISCSMDTKCLLSVSLSVWNKIHGPHIPSPLSGEREPSWGQRGPGVGQGFVMG
eukprot:2059591-Pyramimonas_sp.AAC.1